MEDDKIMAMVYSCIFVTQNTKNTNAAREKQQHQRAKVKFMLMKKYNIRVLSFSLANL